MSLEETHHSIYTSNSCRKGIRKNHLGTCTDTDTGQNTPHPQHTHMHTCTHTHMHTLIHSLTLNSLPVLYYGLVVDVEETHHYLHWQQLQEGDLREDTKTIWVHAQVYTYM